MPGLGAEPQPLTMSMATTSMATMSMTTTVEAAMVEAATVEATTMGQVHNDCASTNSCNGSGSHSTHHEPGAGQLENASTTNGLKLLEPYSPARDPLYPVRGPVGEGKFILSRSGPPTIQELSNDQILLIVRDDIATDLEVNTLVWKCLGYRYDAVHERWEATHVFPKWKERFLDPPDLIGMRREYSKEIDSLSLRSNQALVKSIPMEHKQSLKTHLRPLGWKGYQYSELTPNKTRRAQCSNWLIYFREELFGYTIEELIEKRRRKIEDEDAAQARALKYNARKPSLKYFEGPRSDESYVKSIFDLTDVFKYINEPERGKVSGVIHACMELKFTEKQVKNIALNEQEQILSVEHNLDYLTAQDIANMLEDHMYDVKIVSDGGGDVNRTKPPLPPTTEPINVDAPAPGMASEGTKEMTSSSGEAPKTIEVEDLKFLISHQRVMLFMKGVPSAPQCGFSRQILELLDSYGTAYGTVDVLTEDAIRECLKEYSDWPTYPQLYIEGELVGGWDIVKELDKDGELEGLLKGLAEA